MNKTQLTPKQQLLLWELLCAWRERLSKRYQAGGGREGQERAPKAGLCAHHQKATVKLHGDDGSRLARSGRNRARLFQEGELRISADRRMLQLVLASLSGFARKRGFALHEVFAPAKTSRARASGLANHRGRQSETDPRGLFRDRGAPCPGQCAPQRPARKTEHIDRKDLDAALYRHAREAHAQLMNFDILRYRRRRRRRAEERD